MNVVKGGIPIPKEKANSLEGEPECFLIEPTCEEACTPSYGETCNCPTCNCPTAYQTCDISLAFPGGCQ